LWKASLSCHHHDFDDETWIGKVAAQTRSDRRVGGIYPGIPNFVHRTEITHIGNPNLSPEQIRLAGTALGQQGINFVEAGLGLLFDIFVEVVGDLAGEIDDAVMLNCLAHPRSWIVAGDCHFGLLISVINCWFSG
jgi:hypothetical protein